MKYDIKINYSIIDEIRTCIKTYKSALEEMQGALDKINSRLENENSGSAVTALIGRHEDLQKDIDTCKEELESLYSLFNGYYEEMTDIIHPLNYSEMVRVDRLDIWWNMESIFQSITALETLAISGAMKPIYDHSSNIKVDFSKATEEEDKRKEENNYRKIEEIWDIIKSYENRFEDDKDDMKNLFNNKIVLYEEKDNEYGNKANEVYVNNATLWDRTKNFGSDLVHLGEGVVNIAKDVVMFPILLARGGLEYGIGGTNYLLSNLTGTKPINAGDTIDKFHKTNEKVKSVFNRPWEAVEDTAQEVSDEYEEKGAMYTVGYYGPAFLLTKGKGKETIIVNACEIPALERVFGPRIKVKFPDELMPKDGKILNSTIVDGKIKDIGGLRRMDFVINKEGKLIVGKRHHMLGNADEVFAAGELKVDGQGMIRKITNESGHYRPTVEEAMNYANVLEKSGLNLDKAWLRLYDIKVNSDGIVIDSKVVINKKIK